MAVNQVHLAVPAAITVALIIASIKGSMVASVFMHLSHEKKWIYGALLLTVVFFIVLMSVPLFTHARPHRHADCRGAPGAGRARRTVETEMSLRAFHLVFISMSVVLAAFVAAWAAQQYQHRSMRSHMRRPRSASLASGAAMAFYGAAFQRKTRRL